MNVGTLFPIRPYLTLRGAAVLSFALYLLLGPVRQGQDVLAAVLGVGLLVLMGALLGTSVYLGFRLRSQLSAQLHAGQREITIDNWHTLPSATQSHLMSVEMEGMRIPPGYHLVIRPGFAPALQPGVLLVASSNASPQLNISFSAAFPHRGVWSLPAIDCTLRDNFGLTVFHWQFALNNALDLTVVPPFLPTTRAPIFTSGTREGDLITSTRDRQGDPFDIKPYHPADGMRKVVWKLYARRRELYSRHPEFASSPDGVTAMLVWAGPSEDQVCSEAVAYARQLAAMDIGILAICRDSQLQDIARTPSELLERCTRTSRTKGHPAAQAPGLAQQTLSVLFNVTELQRIVIFCSFAATHEAKELAFLNEIGALISAHGASPIFIAIGEPGIATSSHSGAALRLRGSKGSLAAFVRSLLFYPGSAQTVLHDSPSHAFVAICREKRWGLEILGSTEQRLERKRRSAHQSFGRSGSSAAFNS